MLSYKHAMEHKEDCDEGFVWRKPHQRVSKVSGKVSHIKGKCVKARVAKAKSPSQQLAKQMGCKSGETYRRAHERRLRDGRVVSVAEKCVKSPKKRSPKKSPKRSPRSLSPFAKTLLAKQYAKEMSASRRSPKSFSPFAKALFIEECPEGMVWRSPHQRKLRNGKHVEISGKCVKSPMKQFKSKSKKLTTIMV